MISLGIDIRSLTSRSPSTGVARYAENMVRALLSVAHTDPSLSIRLFMSGKNYLPNSEFSAFVDRVSLPSRALNALWFASLGPRLEKNFEYTYLWLPNAAIMNFRDGVPYALTVHDISFIHYPQFYTLKSRAWHSLTRFSKLLYRANKLITVSEFTKHDLLRQYSFLKKKPILVNYPAINNGSVVSPGDKQAPEKPYILYVGALDKRKNIECIVKSFESISVRFPTLKLVLVGPRNSMSKRSLMRIQKNRTILLYGYVSNSLLSNLYARAGAVVWPSFYEGFGFPPLEALQFNTPIITSYRAALPELLTKHACYVNPYNSGELTAALLQTLRKDNNTRMLYSLPASHAVRTWDMAAAELINFLQTS